MPFSLLSLVSRRVSDVLGLVGVFVQAGLEEGGQMMSRQDVQVDVNALFT